jgi:hypothetical protein
MINAVWATGKATHIICVEFADGLHKVSLGVLLVEGGLGWW